MKAVLYLVASLSALASAASLSKRGDAIYRKGYCSSALSYGTCQAGVEKYGAYHYRNHCKQIVDLEASDYIVESVHRGLSFDECVLGCSHDEICCAINYEICGAKCQYLQRTDGTDYCYKSPIIFTRAASGFESSGIIPPSEVPGSVYGGN